MTDRSVLATGVAVVLLLAASPTRANPVIDIASYGTGAGLYGISINYPPELGPPPTPLVNDGNVFAGVINLNDSSNPSYFKPGITWSVFCTDIFTYLNTTNPFFVATGTLDNGYGAPLSATTQAEIGWLVNNYFQNGIETNGLVTGNPNEFAAATQIAVWQTEYGPDFTFGSGDNSLLGPFGYVTSLVDAAASYGSSFAGNIDEWEASDASGNPEPLLNQGQGFIGSSGLTNEVPPPVPEPASLALLSAGLFGLAAVRRRKRG